MNNEELALYIIKEAVSCGVSEFCLCPGARNAPLYSILMRAPSLKKYFWFEERSAAFFALGRARSTGRPVAVITTSGTASGELLPAAMESFYTGAPLLLVTADRPRRFRGSGAPQTAEQVGLFSHYAPFSQDIAFDEPCRLSEWNCDTPAHLNVCFEEPFPKNECKQQTQCSELCAVSSIAKRHEPISEQSYTWLKQFLHRARYPFVVVGSLKEEAKEAVISFLRKLNAPVFLEGISGIREDVRLQHLRIVRTDQLWKASEKAGYPIDAILRIGGVPTFRLWRDIEELEGKISVCSINDVPFSGLSWADIIHVPLDRFFAKDMDLPTFDSETSRKWLSEDNDFCQQLNELIEKEPFAEPSILHQLSKQIPHHSLVYLGNSLPIREWDLAAINQNKQLKVKASRGVNGIDGQLSTFFGLCHPNQSNWGIFGDLTALYDLASPWVLPQLEQTIVNIVIINNGGGQLFSRFLPDKEFLNAHDYHFDSMASLWKLKYERWDSVPSNLEEPGNRIIEIVPETEATQRFNKKLSMIF